jgi:CDP-diacylglycerol--glycerol-3-phosphate 3-phosphatidyltransferase
MSLANRITLARAVLIPPIVVLLFLNQRAASLGLFLLASFGDVLDGMVARRRGEVTTWGKALDPAVDKVLYLSLFVSLVVLGEISLLALILFVVPQLGLGIGALCLRIRARIVQGARGPGKLAAILTFAAMVFLLLPLPHAVHPYRMWFLYAAIGVSYLTALDYLRCAIRATGSLGKDTSGTPAEPAPQGESASPPSDG